jgi:putative lipoprotein
MKIPTDKLYHFGVCALIAFFGAAAFRLLLPASVPDAIGGAALALAVGVGKEYGDSKAPGNHWCWWDLLADLLGAACGAALTFAIV